MSHDPTPDLNALGNDGFRNTAHGRELALWVRSNPVTALQAIASGAIAHPARALDNVIAAIGDDAKARELVNEHVTAADQASLLSDWGDRISALAQLASPEAIVEGIRKICQDWVGKDDDAETEIAIVSAVIRGLALQISDRKDWDEVLDQEIGGHTLRDYLIACIAADVEAVPADDGIDVEFNPDAAEEAEAVARHARRPADVWVNVGLDPDSAEERLLELGDEFSSGISAVMLFRVRTEMAAKRESVGLPAAANEGDGGDS